MGKCQRRQGSVIVLVLAILAVSTILLAALVQLIETANKQTAISRDMVRYRTVLDSLLDYTIHGIKQRWCFSRTMLDETCNWNHMASSERLIMGDNVVRALSDMKTAHPTFPANPPFRLHNFDMVVPIRTITATHPLFRAIQPAQSAVFTDMRFEVWRMSNINVPQHGDEALLGIRVTLYSTTTLFRGLNTLTATSTLMVFPRQLNQFALIVPRDLRLDLGTGTSVVGDFNVARFGSRSSSGAGLSFESPVFVNRNVHIIPHSDSGDPPYAPATFAQRLVLGNGRVFEDNTLMSPSTPGGEASRTYDQVSGLGGFLRGIEIDGVLDRGLEVFTGQMITPPVDTSRLDGCRDYLAAKSDLTITRDSPLYVQTGDQAGPGMTVNYNLALGSNNAFNPQRQMAGVPGASSIPVMPVLGWSQRPEIPVQAPAVAYLFGQFGTAMPATYVQARLAFGSQLNLSFRDPAGGPPARMVVSLNPVLTFGKNQHNQAQLNFAIAPGANLALIPSPMRIYMKAYDYGTASANDRRRDTADVDTFNINFLREANFQFEIVPGVGLRAVQYSFPLNGNTSHQFYYGSTCPGVIPMPLPPATGFVKGSACSGPGAVVNPTPQARPFTNLPPSPAVDYADYKERCEHQNSERGNAFGSANWGTVNFLPSTRTSWNFNPNLDNAVVPVTYPAPASDEQIFNATTDNEFIVRAIVGTCRITAAASRVQGLLACDRFVISPRTTPLQINGSIIAGQSDIAPSALSAGIRWRSLRHSQAIYDLRTNLSPTGPALLHQQNFGNCPANLAIPEFSPVASIGQMATQQQCNPMRFAQAADPFNWTTVDPDCGVNSGDSFVTCKRRPLRYVVREINRTSD